MRLRILLYIVPITMFALPPFVLFSLFLELELILAADAESSPHRLIVAMCSFFLGCELAVLPPGGLSLPFHSTRIQRSCFKGKLSFAFFPVIPEIDGRGPFLLTLEDWPSTLPRQHSLSGIFFPR